MKTIYDIVIDELQDARNSDTQTLHLEKVCNDEETFLKTLTEEQIALYRTLEESKAIVNLDEIDRAIHTTIKVVKSLVQEINQKEG